MDPRQQQLMGMLGNGLARGAGQNLMMNPQYQQYAMQMQESGQQPLPPEQWMQMMKMQQASQMQGLLTQ